MGLVGGGEIEQIEQFGECIVGVAAGQTNQVANFDRALERGTAAVEQVVDRDTTVASSSGAGGAKRRLIELVEPGDAGLQELPKLRARRSQRGARAPPGRRAAASAATGRDAR